MNLRDKEKKIVSYAWELVDKKNSLIDTRTQDVFRRNDVFEHLSDFCTYVEYCLGHHTAIVRLEIQEYFDYKYDFDIDSIKFEEAKLKILGNI